MNNAPRADRGGRRANAMTEARLWVALLRHGALLWRTGLLRFRLETFGTYYPAPPYQTPAWRLTPAHTVLLLRRARAYGRWLVEMEQVRRTGAHGWWELRHTIWEGIPDD
jgi:hypothetical protein